MEINEERVVAALRNAQRVQSHGDAEWERVARSGTLHGAALQSPETDAPVIDRIVEELGGVSSSCRMTSLEASTPSPRTIRS